MKVVAMDAHVRVPKVKTPKARSRLLRGWKFDKSNRKQYMVNQVESEWLTPSEFLDLQEYMNEWLNHPLYPVLFDY